MLGTAKDGGHTGPLGSFQCLTILTTNKFFLKSNHSFPFLSMGAHLLKQNPAVFRYGKPKQHYPWLSPTSSWRRDERRSHSNFADRVSGHYAAHLFAQIGLRQRKGCGSLFHHEGEGQPFHSSCPSCSSSLGYLVSLVWDRPQYRPFGSLSQLAHQISQSDVSHRSALPSLYTTDTGGEGQPSHTMLSD